MKRSVKKLTELELKKAAVKEDKDYNLSDGDGLYFIVRRNGSKFFRLDFRYGGKRLSMSLGTYPKISLKEARDKKDECKKLLSENINSDSNESDEQSRNLVFALRIIEYLGKSKIHFEKFNNECVLTSEIDKFCKTTYLNNFEEQEFNTDIKILDEKSIKDFNILSFTCCFLLPVKIAKNECKK